MINSYKTFQSEEKGKVERQTKRNQEIKVRILQRKKTCLLKMLNTVYLQRAPASSSQKMAPLKCNVYACTYIVKLNAGQILFSMIEQ